MKWIPRLLLGFLPLVAVAAMPQGDVIKLVAAAAGKEGPAYIEARGAILAMGTNALPQLAHAATDGALTWQERLTARICYERIERERDIQTLRTHDWKQYPPYIPGPSPRILILEIPVTNADGKVVTETRTETTPGKVVNIRGPQAEMGEFVVPRCREAGLWYYYLETYWKKTGENAMPSPDKGFDHVWPWWCVAAVEDQPEDYYRIRILVQWLMDDKDLSDPYAREFCRALYEKKIPDSVPVLVERHATLFKKNVGSIEAFPGSHEITFRGMLEPILSFADSRHADMIVAAGDRQILRRVY